MFGCDLPFQLRNLICSQDVVIQADDEIRLKIVGTRVDASGIVSSILYEQLFHSIEDSVH